MSGADGHLLRYDPMSPAALGFDSTPLELAPDCDPQLATQPELAIQVRRAPSPTATSFVKGVRITYTYQGETRSLDVLWKLGWCGTSEPSCSAA